MLRLTVIYSEITEKHLVNARYMPPLDSENSLTCATLCGHLSNSWALAKSLHGQTQTDATKNYTRSAHHSWHWKASNKFTP